jgi:hypothetical protein
MAEDTTAAEQAFVAYFTTVIGRPVTFEGLRDGRIIAEALNHEQVLLCSARLLSWTSIDVLKPINSMSQRT